MDQVQLGICAANGAAGDTWALLEQAYIYSFPLMLMDTTMQVSTNAVTPGSNGKAPANRWMHAKTLATAKFRQVVTPNVDTLYSQVFFDLRDDALVLHKPASDRYLMYQIMDAWSDTVAVLGTGGDTDEARDYLLTGPRFDGTVPDGMVQVKLPTAIGWLLGRTICYGPEDRENIYAIQSQMDAKTLSVLLSGGEMPEGTYDESRNGVPIRMTFGMGPKAYFDRFNKLLADNPPYPEDAALLKSLEAIGVGAGRVFDPSILGADGAEKWKAMLGGLTKKLIGRTEQFMVRNGAFKFYGDPISRFGAEYDYRCLVAIAGFGANPVDVAVYMKAGFDDAGEALDGKNRYVLHFAPDALPPVGEKGFWSVTAYGDDDFLIDNPIDRYSISDRTDCVRNADGSLDLYLQKDAPEGKTANWLPISGEGFHLFLRVYRPEPSVLNGTWHAPALIKQ